MSLLEINKRYSELATTDCCLSCGGAINYAEAQPDEVCVDLGSGRGTDAIRLAETVGKGGFVFGIDISDGMIEKAFKTAERLGVTNIDFIKSSLERIKLNDTVADLVISNCTINHAGDKQAVWNEIYRILKMGGRFVCLGRAAARTDFLSLGYSGLLCHPAGSGQGRSSGWSGPGRSWLPGGR